MTFSNNLITLCFVGLITYVGNYISYLAMMKPNSPPFDPIGAFLGMVVIIALALVGWLLSKHVKIKLESPTVIWISVLALLISSPIFPGNQWVASVTKHVSFMAITTPVLAYAGLSLGKDITKFKELGWRIIIVSLLVFTGTFVLATLFAQIMLHLNGTI